jgi:hypothetical protein
MSSSIFMHCSIHLLIVKLLLVQFVSNQGSTAKFHVKKTIVLVMKDNSELI